MICGVVLGGGPGALGQAITTAVHESQRSRNGCAGRKGLLLGCDFCSGLLAGSKRSLLWVLSASTSGCEGSGGGGNLDSGEASVGLATMGWILKGGVNNAECIRLLF